MKNKNINYLILALFFTTKLFSFFNFANQNSTFRLSGANASLEISSPISGFEGTLEVTNKSDTSITGSTAADLITFNSGILKTSDSSINLVGTLDPATSDKIILDSGQKLEAAMGTILESIEVKGSGNKISGQPLFSQAITLENSLATLDLGIQTKLNQNIILNGGTLKLIDDLKFEDNFLFSGNGTIDLNNKTLQLPSVVPAWNSDITALNANDVTLTGYTPFSGNFSMTGVGGTTNLNGSGNILELGGGGNLIIGNGHTAFFTDVHIKGVGAGGGSITFSTATSALRMVNCTISFVGNYTQTNGTTTVEGDNCTFIFPSSSTYTVSGGTTVFNVDGVVLKYELLTNPWNGSVPIQTASGGTINFLNSGQIRNTKEIVSYSFSTPTATADNTLTQNINLSSTQTLTFTNASPGTPKTMTLDSNGQTIKFNSFAGQHFVLEPNITLTIKNTVLEDFDPARINFQGAGAAQAKIEFDDNCQISLSKDLSISSQALTFVGDCQINGNSKTLSLDASQMLTLNNAKTLTINQLRINTGASDALKCLNASSKIILQKSEIFMDENGLDFDTGNLDILNNAIISGEDPTTPSSSSTFTFSSAGQMQVLTGSNLKINPGSTFFYNPDVSGDSGNPLLEKYHFKLADPSSKLELNSCTFQTGANGFALAHGKVEVDGLTKLEINLAAGAEVEFGTILELEIMPAGTLDINGPLKYITTSYP